MRQPPVPSFSSPRPPAPGRGGAGFPAGSPESGRDNGVRSAVRCPQTALPDGAGGGHTTAPVTGRRVLRRTRFALSGTRIRTKFESVPPHFRDRGHPPRVDCGGPVQGPPRARSPRFGGSTVPECPWSREQTGTEDPLGAGPGLVRNQAPETPEGCPRSCGVPAELTVGGCALRGLLRASPESSDPKTLFKSETNQIHKQ